MRDANYGHYRLRRCRSSALRQERLLRRRRRVGRLKATVSYVVTIDRRPQQQSWHCVYSNIRQREREVATDGIGIGLPRNCRLLIILIKSLRGQRPQCILHSHSMLLWRSKERNVDMMPAAPNWMSSECFWGEVLITKSTSFWKHFKHAKLNWLKTTRDVFLTDVELSEDCFKM